MADKLPYGAVGRADDKNYVFEVNRQGQKHYINAPTLDDAFDIVNNPDFDRQQEQQQEEQELQKKREAQGQVNRLEAAARGLADGVSFGFAKYPVAAFKSAMADSNLSPFTLSAASLGVVPPELMGRAENKEPVGTKQAEMKENFQRELEDYKKRDELAHTAYPAIYNTSSIVGTIAPMVATGGAAAAARGGLAGARVGSGLLRLADAGANIASREGIKGVVGRAALSAPAGAAIGALDAAGHDEDVANGALVGGALGAAASPAIDLARPLLRWATGASNRAVAKETGVTRRALNKLESIRDKSNLTNEDIINSLRDADNLGANAYTVADTLGVRGARALSGLARRDDDLGAKISDFLTSRQVEQPRRLTQAFNDAAGEELTSAQKRLATRAQQRELGNAEYGRVREEAPEIDINSIRNYLNERTSTLADPLGSQLQPYTSLKKISDMLGDTQTAPFSSVHTLKQTLDDMAQAAFQRGDRHLGTEISNVSRQINGAIEAQSPTYAQAAQNWRTSQKALEAIDAGRGSSTRRADDIIDQFRALATPEEQQAFRVGFASKPLEQIENARVGSDLSRRYLTQANQETYPAVFGEQQGDRLLRQLQLEKAQNETFNRALGGSRTADNLSDMEAMQGVLNHAPTSPREAVGRLMNMAADAVGRRTFGMNQQDKEALTRLLLSRPNNETTRFFQRLIDNDALNERNARLLLEYVNPTLRSETVRGRASSGRGDE